MRSLTAQMPSHTSPGTHPPLREPALKAVALKACAFPTGASTANTSFRVASSSIVRARASLSLKSQWHVSLPVPRSSLKASAQIPPVGRSRPPGLNRTVTNSELLEESEERDGSEAWQGVNRAERGTGGGHRRSEKRAQLPRTRGCGRQRTQKRPAEDMEGSGALDERHVSSHRRTCVVPVPQPFDGDKIEEVRKPLRELIEFVDSNRGTLIRKGVDGQAAQAAVKDLCELQIEEQPSDRKRKYETSTVRLAVMGKPGRGKSLFLNLLLDSEIFKSGITSGGEGLTTTPVVLRYGKEFKLFQVFAESEVGFLPLTVSPSKDQDPDDGDGLRNPLQEALEKRAKECRAESEELLWTSTAASSPKSQLQEMWKTKNTHDNDAKMEYFIVEAPIQTLEDLHLEVVDLPGYGDEAEGKTRREGQIQRALADVDVILAAQYNDRGQVPRGVQHAVGWGDAALEAGLPKELLVLPHIGGDPSAYKKLMDDGVFVVPMRNVVEDPLLRDSNVKNIREYTHNMLKDFRARRACHLAQEQCRRGYGFAKFLRRAKRLGTRIDVTDAKLVMETFEALLTTNSKTIQVDDSGRDQALPKALLDAIQNHRLNYQEETANLGNSEDFVRVAGSERPRKTGMRVLENVMRAVNGVIAAVNKTTKRNRRPWSLLQGKKMLAKFIKAYLDVYVNTMENQLKKAAESM
ncbi:unnamed protein product, partial [Durusdinium trenchii]